MEIVLLLVVLIVLIVVNRTVNTKYSNLEKRQKDVLDKLYDLEHKIDALELEKKAETYEESAPVEIDTPKEVPEIITTEFKESDPVFQEVAEEEPEPVYEHTTQIEYTEPVREAFRAYEPKTTQRVIKKSIFQKFKEKNPDLEKFIGENLINKIGILILVLGVSFFVKYAIDKEWINEPARVGIGILIGALVMFVSHRLRKNYKAFSSVLVAGAISIFYFTIYIAFQDYQLFSQTVAFAIMVVITIFSVFISVSYDRQELAILSLIGGFAAPFLVSTGEGNYIVLFSYIAILDIGILTISYFRKWKIVTAFSFVLTSFIFGGWVASTAIDGELPHVNALLFATLFYFIFSITLVLGNIRNKGIFAVLEYLILIVNTFFFFGVGLTILRDWESDFTGLFTLLLAVYNVLYAVILSKRFGLEKNAVFVLIGLALTFVTLTIPIQFEGNQITLFWAAESVLLFWLFQRSKINSFKRGSVIVVCLAVMSLLVDWFRYGSSEEFGIVFNPLFLAGIVVCAALYLLFWLSRNEEGISFRLFTIPIAYYRFIIILLAVLITYFTGFLEVRYQSNQYIDNGASVLSFQVAYHFAFLAVLFYVSTRIQKVFITKSLLVIGVFTVLFYVADFYVLPSNELVENYSFGKDVNFAFYLHYVVLICLGYVLYRLFTEVASLEKGTRLYKGAAWALVFVVVYTASNEVMVHNLYFFHGLDMNELATNYSPETRAYSRIDFVENTIDEVKTQIIKIGYPILWGVLSFIFLIVGILKQLKNLRIMALTLLGLTIVKLFVYDIQNVSETGKIFAFVLLGVVILIISFVYQRIKKMVIDESPKTIDENEYES